MTEDERHELAYAAAALLKARDTRDMRRQNLQVVIGSLKTHVTNDRITETLETVLDADYVFRGEP